MKKVLSLGLVLSMLISTLPTTVSAAHWADEDVAYLIENGAIAEDDAMLQNLDTPITRSQMVKVIVALLEGDEPIEGKEYFTDITAEDTHIAKAAENGFVNGFGDGTFRPNNPITRQDFFTIVGRAYELTGEATEEFTDADSIADYAKPYVDALQSIGIVNGYGDGTVNPRGNITIAETLAVMHRVDEYVKANTPEEPTEEPKKPTGGGGGGYVGGGHATGGAGSSTIKCTQRPSVTFTVERTEDYSEGIVAYVTAKATASPTISRKLLLTDSNYYDENDSASRGDWEIADRQGQYISQVNGKFAIPDYGTYKLILLDSSNNTWGVFWLTVDPPESEDTTPPEFAVEVSEDTTLPLEVKINASDDTQVGSIDYVKFSDLYDDDKANRYKTHVNGRVSIGGDSFTIEECGEYGVRVRDTAGNCAYAEITVAEENDGRQVQIKYDSESISELPDGSGHTNLPGLSAAITVEREKDFSGQYVAYAKVNIANSRGPIEKKLLLKDSGYYSGRAGGVEYIWDVAEEYGQGMYEEDGKFAIPDFGAYTLYVRDALGIWDKYKFSVNAPNPDDLDAPKLEIEQVGGDEFPITFKVSASDDAGIARITYVEPTSLSTHYNYLSEKYKIHVNGRKLVEDDTITITEKAGYIVCAMDNNGNCTYKAIYAKTGYNNAITISGTDYTYSYDNGVPWIEHCYSTSQEVDGMLDIYVNIGDSVGVVEKGYFVLPEYYLNTFSDKYDTIQQTAYVKVSYKLDLSQDIEDLLQYTDMCGGKDAMYILKNYYEATLEGSGVEITPIVGDTITLKENGVYFIYAKDAKGNLTILREGVDKMKRPSVSLSAKAESNPSNGYAGQITARIGTNQLAPIKKMFLVKSGYEYGDTSGEPTYLKRTINGEALKVWRAVEKTGQYLPVESTTFTVPDYGKYTLYVLDEFGNWASGEVEVKKPYGSDTTLPKVKLQITGDASLPLGIEVETSDDFGVARISYVKVSDKYMDGGDTPDTKMLFETYINNRKIIWDDGFIIDSPGTYAVGVTDTSGNCAYAAISVNDSGDVNIF